MRKKVIITDRLAIIQDWRCGVPYLADQVYLRPHPVELMLRNHV